MDGKNRCVSQEAEFTCPQLTPPPTADVKRAAPRSQKIMDMNILSTSYQVVPEFQNKKLARTQSPG